MLLSSSCSYVLKGRTEFTIPPEHLVISVNWPYVDVPLDQPITNKDIVLYIQALEEELKIQENNYVEFNTWRWKMIDLQKEVNSK